MKLPTLTPVRSLIFNPKIVISSNVSNVAGNNGLSDEEVNSMIEDVAQKLLPINLSNLRRLGID